MKYIIAIAMILLLTACTNQITATQKETSALEADSLGEIPAERIPISPTSTGEKITQQQLKACAERDQLKEEIIPLRTEQSELFPLAKDQQIDIDRTNVQLQKVKNKLESSLLASEQIADLSNQQKELQEKIDEQLTALRETNKRLKAISEELVQKERDSEFLRFRCADLQ